MLKRLWVVLMGLFIINAVMVKANAQQQAAPPSSNYQSQSEAGRVLQDLKSLQTQDQEITAQIQTLKEKQKSLFNQLHTIHEQMRADRAKLQQLYPAQRQ